MILLLLALIIIILSELMMHRVLFKISKLIHLLDLRWHRLLLIKLRRIIIMMIDLLHWVFIVNSKLVIRVDIRLRILIYHVNVKLGRFEFTFRFHQSLNVLLFSIANFLLFIDSLLRGFMIILRRHHIIIWSRKSHFKVGCHLWPEHLGILFFLWESLEPRVYRRCRPTQRIWVSLDEVRVWHFRLTHALAKRHGGSRIFIILVLKTLVF